MQTHTHRNVLYTEYYFLIFKMILKVKMALFLRQLTVLREKSKHLICDIHVGYKCPVLF